MTVGRAEIGGAGGATAVLATAGWRRPVVLGLIAVVTLALLVAAAFLAGGSGTPRTAASTRRPTTTTSSTTTTTTAPTPQSTLDALRSVIDDQAASGAIDSQAQTQLLQRVDAAQSALDSGSAAAAQGPLNDLLHQLGDLERHGGVDASAGSAISQAAQAVLATLPAPTSGGGGPGKKGGDGGDNG